MSSPIAFQLVLIQFLGGGPAFRAPKNHHRPPRPLLNASPASIALNGADPIDALIKGHCHFSMHYRWVITFDKIRSPAKSLKETVQFLRCDPRRDCWIRDLIAVQMKNR